MRSIVKCIYNHSIAFPEKTAIIGTDCTVDYKTLWKMITRVSALLQKHGVHKGDRVILEADHTVEFLVCCYGIHLAGAVHVPVENSVPMERVAEIGKEIEPTLVLTGKHPLALLGTSIETICDTEITGWMFPDEEMLQEILFTTGTTGKSKGVMITHYGQMNMCDSQNAVLDYSIDNMWLIPSPMNHAAGLRKTHMSMVKGSSVLLINGFTNLKKFFESMREHNVTSLYLPPAGTHYILTLASKELGKFNDQLDFIYSSSSALPGGDKEKLIKLLPDVRMFDAYGGSEVGAAFYIDFNAHRGDSRCVGKPNPGVEVTIVDEDYNPIESSEDNPGIIAIKSNTVTAGYWREPELTAKTIQDGVIYMSDLGYLKDGYLYLVGRRDDVINVGGLKIAPTEVEDVVLRHPAIAECVCIPYEDKMFGRVVKLLVCMKDGFALDTEDLTSFLKGQLEAYKVPKYIEAVSEIPRTYNGKINRKQIIATYNQ